jgi:hypothetical protein
VVVNATVVMAVAFVVAVVLMPAMIVLFHASYLTSPGANASGSCSQPPESRPPEGSLRGTALLHRVTRA